MNKMRITRADGSVWHHSRKSMTLDQCAAKMTAFLARKPKAKTAAYVATLPKREPIKVSPMDYVACPFERARLGATGISAQAGSIDRLKPAKVFGDPARYAAWEARGCPPSPLLPPKRKDRVRHHGIGEPQYQSLMERLIIGQGGRCFLCGEMISADTELAQNDPLRASFDHVVPVSQGGHNERNRLAAHRDCNGRKADRMPYACEMLFLETVNYFVDRIGPNVKVRTSTGEKT